MSPLWRVQAHQGSAATLHAGSAALLDVGSVPRAARAVRVLTSTTPAVVLGSGQPDRHVDAERAAGLGIEVVRRRSGGGAVMVGPGIAVWIDVVVPAGDPLWQPDVGRAAWWLGEVWAAALAEIGLSGAEVWRGGQVRSEWSDRVCFAGLGAGEVTVAGRKMVGISQRRTRLGALFQCAVPITWAPAALLDVLRLSPSERRDGRAQLEAVAAGVGAEREGPLAAAVIAGLP